MKLLKEINNVFYSYFDHDTKMLFTMRHGNRGIYGAGRAWYLSVTYDGAQQTIATFSTKDDNHKSYKDDYMGRLWENVDAVEEADRMVCKMIGK